MCHTDGRKKYILIYKLLKFNFLLFFNKCCSNFNFYYFFNENYLIKIKNKLFKIEIYRDVFILNTATV